ncbi:MAG: T9SS type A sorting domain-containing protein [Candidatus Kapabacteria bacterium]|nr:T9SS type A sorting domain-containing protein [Candidatus Kapabacteria bacterium]
MINNHPQGPVVINHSSGTTTWQTGRAIYLKEGFRKTSTGIFRAKILQLLDCYNQYSLSTGGQQESEDNNTPIPAQVTASGYMDKSGVVTAVTNDDIFITPNPANTHITISGRDLKMTEMYSPLGMMVMKLENDYHSIDITRLPSGTYYVRCTTPQGVVVKPFVIVR